MQLLALYLAFTTSPAEIIAAAAHAKPIVATAPAWYMQTPWLEILSGLRAIVPLVLFLLVVMWLVLKENIQNPSQITYGITLAVIGMIMFNLGLSYGLAKLGGQSGGLIPAAFMGIDNVAHSPLYNTLTRPIAGVCVLVATGFWGNTGRTGTQCPGADGGNPHQWCIPQVLADVCCLLRGRVWHRLGGCQNCVRLCAGLATDCPATCWR